MQEVEDMYALVSVKARTRQGRVMQCLPLGASDANLNSVRRDTKQRDYDRKVMVHPEQRISR